jgi:hypothetical protein
LFVYFSITIETNTRANSYDKNSRVQK